MTRGNGIIVSANPQGKNKEGVIDDTSLPGTCMQLVGGSALQQGRFHYQAAAPGTDGRKTELLILTEDDFQGKLVTAAYVAGTRCKMYVPMPGEEMNLLCGEVAGTGNSYAVGDRLMVDAEDGIFVPDTGTANTAVAKVLEAKTQVSGSILIWCEIL